MKILLILLLSLLGTIAPALATPSVEVHLQVAPETHSFTCRYRFTLPASNTTSVVRLNLNGRFKLQQVLAPHALQQGVIRVAYPGDTLHQVWVRYGPNPRRSRYIELVYTGNIEEGNYTDHVNLFSGHSSWLPFRPYEEYEVLPYQLTVQVPPGYRSAAPARPAGSSPAAGLSRAKPAPSNSRPLWPGTSFRPYPPPALLSRLSKPVLR